MNEKNKSGPFADRLDLPEHERNLSWEAHEALEAGLDSAKGEPLSNPLDPQKFQEVFDLASNDLIDSFEMDEDAWEALLEAEKEYEEKQKRIRQEIWEEDNWMYMGIRLTEKEFHAMAMAVKAFADYKGEDIIGAILLTSGNAILDNDKDIVNLANRIENFLKEFNDNKNNK